MLARNWKQLNFQTDATPGNADPLSGTPILARFAICRGNSANSADITIGPDNTASYETVSAGGSVEIKAHNGTKFDLAQWYAKSTGASQNMVVIYQP